MSGKRRELGTLLRKAKAPEYIQVMVLILYEERGWKAATAMLKHWQKGGSV